MIFVSLNIFDFGHSLLIALVSISSWWVLNKRGSLQEKNIYKYVIGIRWSIKVSSVLTVDVKITGSYLCQSPSSFTLNYNFSPTTSNQQTINIIKKTMFQPWSIACYLSNSILPMKVVYSVSLEPMTRSSPILTSLSSILTKCTSEFFERNSFLCVRICCLAHFSSS